MTAVSPLFERDSGPGYLGPGRVVAGEALGHPQASVDVELRDGRVVPAKLALAHSYEPRGGDELVVVSDGSEHYVIGLLHASGPVVVELDADITLRAKQSLLKLVGDEGVEIRGRTIRIDAQRMRVIAESLVETTSRLYQQVRGLLSIRSEEKVETVSGELSTRADTATLVGSRVVSINGKEIHLG